MAIAHRKLEILNALDQKVQWLSTWMIHNANHIRKSTDGLKVGGHQASSASSATILCALYFDVLRPQDRVAVKPHASPAFHAIQYLLGRQTREKIENFRAIKGAQSYPSRTKDTDDVDFSTGSVGLGVAQTLFSSLVQDYVRSHGLMRDRPEGRMIAIVGDAELEITADPGLELADQHEAGEGRVDEAQGHDLNDREDDDEGRQPEQPPQPAPARFRVNLRLAHGVPIYRTHGGIIGEIPMRRRPSRDR